MSVPMIALVPPKQRLPIPPRRLAVDVCPSCHRPINEIDECRCTQ